MFVFYIYNCFSYIIVNNLSARYYRKNQRKAKKEAFERYQSLSDKKKKKSDNMT